MLAVTCDRLNWFHIGRAFGQQCRLRPIVFSLGGTRDLSGADVSGADVSGSGVSGSEEF